MAQIACFLVLAGLITGFCHLLPRSRPGRLLTASLLIIIGFVAAQGALSGAITALRLVPRGPVSNLVEYLSRLRW